MQRKLISQGGGGCTIYLPKKWIDRKGLKPGQSIEVADKGTYLVVDSQSAQKKEITIELSETNRHDIRTVLTHIYRQGFDKATIKNTDAHSLNQIKKDCAAYLMGFEVSEVGKSHCIVESISEPAGEKYDVLLRRIFFIIKETLSLIESELSSKRPSRQEEAEELKGSLDKYVLFCRRSISKERMEIENPLLEWELLTFLMHIEHSLHYTYKYASENSCGRQNLAFFRELSGFFNLLYDAYYNKDMAKVHQINKLKKEYVLGKSYSAIMKSKGKEAVVATHIRETYRLVQVASSPVLGIILHSQLEKTTGISS